MTKKKKSTPTKWSPQKANVKAIHALKLILIGSNPTRSQYRNPWVFGYDRDLEIEDEWAGYKNMLAQELQRLNKKPSHIEEERRKSNLASAIENVDVPQQDQTDFLALHMLMSCLENGILPPPWVADRILNVVNARYQKKIKSLDSALGFTEDGRGRGKRIAEVERFLYEVRNNWIGKSVWSWIILGLRVDEAIERVAKFFLRHNQTEWNPTVYDVQIIALLKKGADPHSSEVKTRVEERIRELYFAWKKKNPPLLKDNYYKNLVLNDRQYFENLFPL